MVGVSAVVGRHALRLLRETVSHGFELGDFVLHLVEFSYDGIVLGTLTEALKLAVDGACEVVLDTTTAWLESARGAGLDVAT